MTIEVRELRPDEYAEGGRVTSDAYREFVEPDHPDWDSYLRRIDDIASRAPTTVVLGAFLDGRIVGTTTLEIDGRVPGGHIRPVLDPDEAHIRMLGVDPTVRRQGVARALMEASIDLSRKAGKRRLTLDTTEEMMAARAMYEGLGFVRGEDQVFDDGFRLMWYELAL